MTKKDLTNDKEKKEVIRKNAVMSFSIEKDIAEQLRKFCEQERMSKSQFVQKSIELGLNTFKTNGYVYFIQWGEADINGIYTIKIGYSNNPQRRLEELAGGGGTKLPIELKLIDSFECLHANQVEKMLHRYWIDRGRRVANTEYFKLTKDELDWLLNHEFRQIRKIQDAIGFIA